MTSIADPLRRPPGKAVQAAPASSLESVRGTVTELIPEYRLVHVEAADGRGLALTANTAGIDLAALRIGQSVDCLVTRVQPRVVQAQALD